MRKFICRLRSDQSFAVCVLGLVLAVTGLFVFHTYALLTPEEQAKRRFDQLMAEEVVSVLELSDAWSDAAWHYIEVAIPGATCWTQTKGPLPVDTTKFSKDFLDNVIWYLEGASEVPVAEIFIYQNRLNRDICFLNSDYKPIYVIECPYGDYCADNAYALERYPDLYSGKYDEKEIEEIIAHLDPARVLLKVTMIPSDRLYDYLLDQAKGGDAKEDGGGEGAKSGGGSNDLWVAIVGPGQGATNGIEVTVHLPVGFTNMIDVFTFDAEPENTFDGIQSDPWILSVTNADTTGTNQVFWVDTDTDGITNRFYVAGSSWDQDGDGIASAREIFMHRTDPGLWDTDGDGFSDGDEINIYGTDALDKYSVPPPEMLSVSGSYLVDESTNPVVIKSVNIGAWLQWEQFMMMFKPHLWTNEWGKVYGLDELGADDEVDEASAREFLIENVDNGVTLLAADAPLALNVTTGTVSGSWTWLCDNGVRYIGDFHNGDWVGFTADFGSGVSNVAIGLAVPTGDAGNQIKVRVGSPGNPDIGSLTTTATAPGGLGDGSEWCTFTEQYLTLSTNLSGTQTVYFVGSSGGGSVGNLYRFRFFNDPTNTANLFTTFQENYIATNDLDRIRELGYNCIRLPFFHTLLEDDHNPYVYKQSGWDRLDTLLEECRKRHLWVILDLHSTPGSQNPYQASGFRDPFRNRIWHSDEFKNRTAALWVEIARRYSNETTVAGYDLFNEPVPYTSSNTSTLWTAAQAFSNNIMPMLERLYTAIRSNDTSHVLFMESNLMYTNMWADKDYLWWPDPAAKGWTNVCYQFHVYDRTVYGRTGSDEDSWFITQKPICDTMIRSLRETRNVPVYVGEYAPWNEQNFDYWTRQLQADDFSWGHWNYRSWGWDNPDKPEEGKTLWGLDYRSKATTNEIPDLRNDDYTNLLAKMSLYNHTNYTVNEPLSDVAEQRAREPELSKGTCEFYLNTFDGPDRLTLSEGWPWRKVAVVGADEDAFTIDSSRARLLFDWGPLVMRMESREEADARFKVDDATGCRFSVNVHGFDVASQGAGPEAAVNLCVVRDSISATVSNYDTHGIVARLTYDDNAATVDLYLYAKEGGVNTLGTEEAHISGVTFNSTNCFELFVNETDASLSYGGVEQTNISHGLSLNEWPASAVCVVEAEELSAGETVYVELDDFKAWRADATLDSSFTDPITDYPNGVEIRAETEYCSVEDYYASGHASASFVTNGSVFWIARECLPGQEYGTWMNVRRDYQNDVRLLASPTNVVEVRAAYSNFTDGVGKIVMMPESFPVEVYWEYAGQALYVQFEREGTNMAFLACRHYGVSGLREIRGTSTNTYVAGHTISLQADTNTMRVYYGPDLIISTNHALADFAGVYENGVYPHYEIRNDATSTDAAVLIEDVVSQQLSDFEVP